MKIFTERLKELRVDENLSVGDLAKEIGVSKMAVSYWERGVRTPNIDELYEIAKFFKVSADYLIGLED